MYNGGNATYISDDYGLLFSRELWVDPPTALRNPTTRLQFSRIDLSLEPHASRKDELLKLKAGEWIRYHV